MTFDLILYTIGRVMPLTCPFLHLSVLKLENRLSQELEIYIEHENKKKERKHIYIFWSGGGGGRVENLEL